MWRELRKSSGEGRRKDWHYNLHGNSFLNTMITRAILPDEACHSYIQNKLVYYNSRWFSSLTTFDLLVWTPLPNPIKAEFLFLILCDLNYFYHQFSRYSLRQAPNVYRHQLVEAFIRKFSMIQSYFEIEILAKLKYIVHLGHKGLWCHLIASWF